MEFITNLRDDNENDMEDITSSSHLTVVSSNSSSSKESQFDHPQSLQHRTSTPTSLPTSSLINRPLHPDIPLDILLKNVDDERIKLYNLSPHFIPYQDDVDDKTKTPRRCKPFPYLAPKTMINDFIRMGFHEWISRTVKASLSVISDQVCQFVRFTQEKLKRQPQ